jgi:hypothetical protein
MPRAPRGSGSSRRPRAEARNPRETVGSRPTEGVAVAAHARRGAAAPIAEEARRAPAPISDEAAGREEALVVEPLAEGGRAARPASAGPRFQIFIIDAGWDSAAHRVLRQNFGLLRELQKGEQIYVLSREKSIEFIRRHRALLLGKDPIIAVHDRDALGSSGTAGFHGFRLHLGLLRTEGQALLALQAFSRFLNANRQAADLEALIRAQLRREGFLGAIEIILHHEPRAIAG